MEILLTTMSKVRRELEKDKFARRDDNFLFAKLAYEHAKNAYGKKVAEQTYEVLWEVLVNGKDNGFPSYETVRRARQDIQEHCPELRPNSKVYAARHKKQQEVHDFFAERKKSNKKTRRTKK